MKSLLVISAIVALAFGASAEAWTIGADGATITAALDDGRLTLSGDGKTVDFVSAAETPWAGKTINDVVFSGDITPGQNLLAGLDESVTINGSMTIGTLRKISGAFLAGEVAPAEASGLSLDDRKLTLSVDVACRDSEQDESWREATVESVEANEAGEVVLTIPVGASEGVCRLRAK